MTLSVPGSAVVFIADLVTGVAGPGAGAGV